MLSETGRAKPAQMESKCAVCGSKAEHKCLECENISYCSKKHQEEDSENHKSLCRPFKICEDPILGRYAVATCPIRAGKVVLCELPLIWGPSQLTAPVCLGCGQLLDPKKQIIPCNECGWPMCSEDECQNVPEDHKPECEFTKGKGTKISITNFLNPHPVYQCITALRILYQRDNNKELWDKLMTLQSHCAERKNTVKYKSDKVSIADFLQNFFKLKNTFSEDEIMRVCGILQVNGHEVPLTDPPYVALYEQTSMFEHSCQPNCSKTFTTNEEVLISAATNIEANEHLSISYTDSMWGTANRRHFLHETKFFKCSCKRCADPTECGTFFSALRCSDKNCTGYALPETFLTDPNKDMTLPWKCLTCKRELSSTFVQNSLERIGEDLNAMQKGDPKSCELFLSYYSKLLHPNHYYMTDVSIALAQLIGQDQLGMAAVSDADLSRKLQLCAQLVQLIERLAPAETRLRGLLLYEEHTALAETAKRRTATGCSDPREWQAMLVRAKDILSEVVQLLQHESFDSPEGRLATQAKNNLKDIEMLLQRTQHTLGDILI